MSDENGSPKNNTGDSTGGAFGPINLLKDWSKMKTLKHDDIEEDMDRAKTHVNMNAGRASQKKVAAQWLAHRYADHIDVAEKDEENFEVVRAAVKALVWKGKMAVEIIGQFVAPRQGQEVSFHAVSKKAMAILEEIPEARLKETLALHYLLAEMSGALREKMLEVIRDKPQWSMKEIADEAIRMREALKQAKGIAKIQAATSAPKMVQEEDGTPEEKQINAVKPKETKREGDAKEEGWKRGDWKQPGRDRRRDAECYTCGGKGHYSNVCPSPSVAREAGAGKV